MTKYYVDAPKIAKTNQETHTNNTKNALIKNRLAQMILEYRDKFNNETSLLFATTKRGRILCKHPKMNKKSRNTHKLLRKEPQRYFDLHK